MLLLGGGWQERPHIGTGMLALAISLFTAEASSTTWIKWLNYLKLLV